jgi:hypothetical protein
MIGKGWSLNAVGFWVRTKQAVRLGTSRVGAAIAPNPYLTKPAGLGAAR